MGKVSLLDCTLRDGGYINDWQFGEETIKGFGKKIASTGIEMFEVGFIKGENYDRNCSVFPDVETIKEMILPKEPELMYVGMLDMSSPVPIERISTCDGTSIDGIRIIFKKAKLAEAYDYCKKIQELGYILFVQLVGTDEYSDKEFIETIELFNALHPYALSIVDSFGLMKRKDFLRYVSLADNNMERNIVLGYHAHNNLQQAFGNAESLVEMNLQRDICIDACVFGMGRGAGNLNLELFAEYMNENFGTHYRIEPMLEIMDEYLNEIYKEKFWGYSLPLYLSATLGCHPNYAIYLAEKDSLPVKEFHELLRSIPKDMKAKFSKENAERFYREYQDKWVDDKKDIERLTEYLKNRKVLLLAPGKTIMEYNTDIKHFIEKNNPIILSVNFNPKEFVPDFVFSSNMRRYSKIQKRDEEKFIVTSNMKDANEYDFMLNFSRYSSENPEIIDNSGLMALNMLVDLNVSNVYVAGMDGYMMTGNQNYYNRILEYDFSKESSQRNKLIGEEIFHLKKKLEIEFITPTSYEVH